MKLDEQTIIQRISELRNEAKLNLEDKQVLKMRILQSVLDARAMRSNSSWQFRNMFSLRPVSIFASLLILVLLGGGVSYAAQLSLPGDILYPVKVSINEKIHSAFAVGAREQAQWDIQRTQRRLQEASELADRGRELNEKEEARLESRFATSADAALRGASELQSGGDRQSADGIASELESVLKVQAQVMARVQADAKLRASTDLRLSAAIKARTDVETDVRSNKDASTESLEAAQGKIGSAENIIKEVRSFLDKQKNNVSVDIYTQALARLTMADDVMAQANIKFDAKMYNEAFVLASRSARLAQETKGLLTSSIRLPNVIIELQSSSISLPLLQGGNDNSGNNKKQNERSSSPSPKPVLSVSPLLHSTIEGNSSLNIIRQ